MIENLVVQKLGDPAAEGLRLMSAFFRIADRDRRREVVALAEQLAKQHHRRTRPTAAPMRDNEPTE
jgi:hypothetical protein